MWYASHATIDRVSHVATGPRPPSRGGCKAEGGAAERQGGLWDDPRGDLSVKNGASLGVGDGDSMAASFKR